jgi:rare lipoprotein A (peptidoglycan hydrolase)
LTRFLLLVVVATLVGCGSAPKKAEPGKPISPKYYSNDGPPESVPENLAQIPDAVPRDEPFHRYANRPYTVFGLTYVPVLDKEPTKERGLASWYGRMFHGRKTASGEIYDMFAMTAAHKTFPIPSYARVTNVKTGQSVVVRINDRGPFHSDRIIDLSYAAAARIGVAQAGSGLVDVERLVVAPGTYGGHRGHAAAPGADGGGGDADGGAGSRGDLAAAGRLLQRRERRSVPRPRGREPRMGPAADRRERARWLPSRPPGPLPQPRRGRRHRRQGARVPRFRARDLDALSGAT